MKFVTCIVFLFFASISCNNSKNQCDRFRSGLYSISSMKGDMPNISIYRNDIIQWEVIEGIVDTSFYSIKWEDDCTYRLKFIRGVALDEIKNGVLLNHIYPIDRNSYKYSSYIESDSVGLISEGVIRKISYSH